MTNTTPPTPEERNNKKALKISSRFFAVESEEYILLWDALKTALDEAERAAYKRGQEDGAAKVQAGSGA